MDSAFGVGVVKRPRPLDTETRDALVAAAEWRLLGLLLERPRDGWREQIDALARETHSQTLRAAARVARDAREGAYLSVFGPGGTISPREIAYRGMEDPGRLLAEIAGFYDAFAFNVTAEDPVDHVAVETGFVGYLHLKEAFAASRRDDEAARIAARGAARFIEEHVRYWAAPVARQLSSAVGSHLVIAAREIARRAGSPPVAPRGPWNLGVGAEAGAEGSAACGDACAFGDESSIDPDEGFF